MEDLETMHHNILYITLLSCFLTACNRDFQIGVANPSLPANESENDMDSKTKNEDSQELPSENNANDTQDAQLKNDECIKQTDHPSTLVKLVQTLHWQASGPTSQYNQVMATPIIAPLKEGGNPVIIANAFQGTAHHDGGLLYAIDGKTGEQLWVSSITTKTIASASAAIARVEQHTQIYFFGLDNYLYALDHNGSQIWKSSVQALASGLKTMQGGPQVADLGDGSGVVILSPLGVFSAKTGQRLITLSGYLDQPVLAADVNFDKLKEIILGDGLYDHLGNSICKFPIAGQITSTAVAQLSATDKFKTIVGINKSTLYGFSGLNCELLFKTGFEGYPPFSGGPINIGPYSQGRSLIAFAGAEFLFGFEHSALKWKTPTQDYSSRMTGSSAFDLNYDGKAEVIYNDERKLRIIDGISGNVLYYADNSSSTLFEYPVVADVDEDGHADIIVAANDSFAGIPQIAHGIRVFSDPQKSFAPARAIWNQHGFNPLDVGPLGEVALGELPKFKGLELVGYRNNISAIEALKPCD